MGEAIQSGLVEKRPRLLDPGHGDSQIAIRVQGAIDQRVEHRVLELLPPLQIERLSVLELRIDIDQRRRRDGWRDIWTKRNASR
jgi:hypothetical protein